MEKIVKWLTCILILMFCLTAHAQRGGTPNPMWKEVDGSPSVRARTIVTRSGVIDNVVGNQISLDVVTWVTVPTLPTDSALAGEASYEDGFFYVAVADNTWQRVALSTWVGVNQFLLLEDATYILLEDGTKLILE